MANVGKYTSPMDSMGMGMSNHPMGSLTVLVMVHLPRWRPDKQSITILENIFKRRIYMPTLPETNIAHENSDRNPGKYHQKYQKWWIFRGFCRSVYVSSV